MGKRRNIVILAFAFVTLSVTATCWYVYRNAEKYIHPLLIPPDYFWLKDPKNIYAKTGIVAIAGREFKIPVAYVDGRFKDGRKEGSVVLEYVLPDFKSKLEYPNREDRRKVIQDGNMSGALLEDPAKKASFDRYIELQESAKNIVDYEGNVYGLEKHTAPRGEGKYSIKPDDTYLERSSDGTISGVFHCSPPYKDTVPTCSYMFNDKGVRYRIRFPIRELPNWRAQKKAAINFIDRFEINTGEQE